MANLIYEQDGSIKVMAAGSQTHFSDVYVKGVRASGLTEYNGCYYRISSSEATLCDTGEVDGKLVVPEKIVVDGRDYPVTRIGGWKKISSIKTTYYPLGDRRRKPEIEEQTDLEVGAFFNSKVRECVLPSSVTEISMPILYGSSTQEIINNSNFSEFKQYFQPSIERIVLSDGITEIGDCYFYCCSNLKYVVFPKNLKRIEDNAFRDCPLTGTLLFPEGLVEVGKSAFGGLYYNDITEIVLPSTVVSIGDGAFRSCKAKGINLPEGLKSVGDHFIDLTYITEKLVFPQTIKRVPILNWNLFARKSAGLKTLPKLIIYNGRKDVDIDMKALKYCKIDFIDENGKCEKKRRIMKSICFRNDDDHVIDFKSLDEKCVSGIAIFSFLSFLFLLVTIICLVHWLE